MTGWGASGPYKKVYEKFGITGTSKYTSIYMRLASISHTQSDIAAVGKKVVDFYRQKGGEVISPLVKAI